MTTPYDVVVIGGGPGGYVAAIKAAQLGLKVACIEQRGALGGTCLNEGCIPSKALLKSSYLFSSAKKDFAIHGIKLPGAPSVDLGSMMKRKDGIVNDLNVGIEGLFKKNKVDYFIGKGSFVSAQEVLVTPSDKKEKPKTLQAKHVIIATGSEVMGLSGVAIDEKQILSSKGALSLKKVPKKLVVIGGGVIGLEMGSVWSRLGAEVTVVEYLDRIVPAIDGEVAKQFQKILEKQGISFKLGTKVVSAKAAASSVNLTLQPASGGKEEKITCDTVLVSIGRKPFTGGLGLDKLGIALDERGRIPVNSHLQTVVPHIYAIGDVIPGPMLAHKAEEDGIAAVEYIVGQAGHVDYNLVPSVIYTHPEVACIGKTEEQLKEGNIPYNIGKFPFMANSRARAIGDTEGFVKILACKSTDEVLGVHIIGPEAGTLIGEAAIAMAYKASSEDIARICHSHPDLNEAIKEAALATFFKPIHI